MSMFWRHVGLKLHLFFKGCGVDVSDVKCQSTASLLGSRRLSSSGSTVAICCNFCWQLLLVRLRLRLESDAELKGSQEPKVK